jgi:hypothetical protein
MLINLYVNIDFLILIIELPPPVVMRQTGTLVNQYRNKLIKRFMKQMSSGGKRCRNCGA